MNLPVLAIFAQNVALYNKNNRVLLPRALCVIGSLGNFMFKLHIFVVNIKIPWATYHTIVPSTEEFYRLNSFRLKLLLSNASYKTLGLFNVLVPVQIKAFPQEP